MRSLYVLVLFPPQIAEPINRSSTTSPLDEGPRYNTMLYWSCVRHYIIEQFFGGVVCLNEIRNTLITSITYIIILYTIFRIIQNVYVHFNLARPLTVGNCSVVRGPETMCVAHSCRSCVFPRKRSGTINCTDDTVADGYYYLFAVKRRSEINDAQIAVGRGDNGEHLPLSQHNMDHAVYLPSDASVSVSVCVCVCVSYCSYTVTDFPS